MSKGITEVKEDTIDSILHNQLLELEESGISENIRGGHILMSRNGGNTCVGRWEGNNNAQ